MATIAYFYPRPPCGGRREVHHARKNYSRKFLSTPSLRRATLHRLAAEQLPVHFYPRPPCGGRRLLILLIRRANYISIHALLAEGDQQQRRRSGYYYKFLSTPSLRRATRKKYIIFTMIKFLSTPSLRRATLHPVHLSCAHLISIHALLAEGDSKSVQKPLSLLHQNIKNFLL